MHVESFHTVFKYTIAKSKKIRLYPQVSILSMATSSISHTTARCKEPATKIDEEASSLMPETCCNERICEGSPGYYQCYSETWLVGSFCKKSELLMEMYTIKKLQSKECDTIEDCGLVCGPCVLRFHDTNVHVQKTV